MTIYGWDASHFDWDRGPMDIATAVRDGIQFMTHKATEGSGFVDDRFDDFARRAKAGGVPLIGAYCVNHRGDQAPQVDLFIRTLDRSAPWWRDGDFAIQLDCERWSNKAGVYAYEPRLAEIRSWCDLFMQRTGGRWRPIVYAPRWVYGDTLKGLGYPLWASDYGRNTALPYRTAYPGDTSSRWSAYSGQVPAVLQYGSDTKIGTQTRCDANAFRGTLTELRALVSGDQMSAASEKAAIDLAYAFFKDDAAGRPAGSIAGRIAAIAAAATADAARDQAMLAAITALSNAGGVEAAPIINAINAVRDELGTQIAVLQAALAASEAERDRLDAALAAAHAAAAGVA